MKLREFRIKANLSVKELAKKLNISESYIYQLERGDKKPSYKIMNKISEVFKISISKLFFEE